MALALFDLDDTLIAGNCETNWFEYLIEQGHYDGNTFVEDIAEFDRQYESGTGDIDDYMYFVLKPLTHQPIETLLEWRAGWFESRGRAMITEKSRALFQRHREAGDTLVVISASNLFCVQPFAEELRADHTMCSIPEIIENRYTGVFVPPACFGEKKITHLNVWLDETGHSLDGAYFYSDSRNDIPLLELVDNPIAVNPDAHLAAVATQRGWQQIELR